MHSSPSPHVRRVATIVLVGVAALYLLSACAGAAGPNQLIGTPHNSNFWAGLWQGLILPITFIVSLFNHNVNIYDVHNNGNWYNFGFALGLSIILGGPAGARRR